MAAAAAVGVTIFQVCSRSSDSSSSNSSSRSRNGSGGGSSSSSNSSSSSDEASMGFVHHAECAIERQPRVRSFAPAPTVADAYIWFGSLAFTVALRYTANGSSTHTYIYWYTACAFQSHHFLLCVRPPVGFDKVGSEIRARGCAVSSVRR